MKFKLKTRAKINLTLEIIKKLPNGYHSLRSAVFKLDNLFDEITIEISKKLEGIQIESNSKEVPLDNKNTCYKAAEKYLQKTGKNVGIKINIKKNIPLAAGLGGGSSNAAGVLLTLNRYFNNLFSLKKLNILAAEIGKDVPLFLRPEKSLVMSGMGEKIKIISSSPKLHLLLVNPQIVISTPKAYALLSKKLAFLVKNRHFNSTKKMEQAIREKSLKKISENLSNDFETVIEKKHPQISKIKNDFLALGGQGTLMSGSGSTVFGLFNSKTKLFQAKKYFQQHYPQYLVKIG